MSSTVVVVGAGIAGLACAHALTENGLDVRVLELGHVPGGRLASPVLDGRPVDLGAAYLTVSDPGFGSVVAGWHDRGLARPWTSHFEVYGQSPHPPDRPNPQRWSAPGGLGSLAADLAADLPVEYGVAVRGLAGLRSGSVVLAMPAPQAALIHPAAAGVADQEWQPSLAVALRYPERCWPDFAGAFVNDHPVLTTVCDDGDRRGDRAPVLVAHTTPGHAREAAPRSRPPSANCCTCRRGRSSPSGAGRRPGRHTRTLPCSGRSKACFWPVTGSAGPGWRPLGCPAGRSRP